MFAFLQMKSSTIGRCCCLLASTGLLSVAEQQRKYYHRDLSSFLRRKYHRRDLSSFLRGHNLPTTATSGRNSTQDRSVLSSTSFSRAAFSRRTRIRLCRFPISDARKMDGLFWK